MLVASHVEKQEKNFTAKPQRTQSFAKKTES
jgi:hypothetical protein